MTIDGTDRSKNLPTTACLVCDERFTRADPPERGTPNRFRCDECIKTNKHLRWMTSADSEEFSSASFEQRLHGLALAYLESAKLLCVALGDHPRALTWPRASVVYFTSHLAAELFLKACVVRRKAEEKLDHDIERLQKRFSDLYPNIEPLDTPWDVSIDTVTALFGLTRDAVVMEDFEHKPDQIYRYGADKQGHPMKGFEQLAPGKWIQWIERTEVAFQRIWASIG